MVECTAKMVAQIYSVRTCTVRLQYTAEFPLRVQKLVLPDVFKHSLREDEVHGRGSNTAQAGKSISKVCPLAHRQQFIQTGNPIQIRRWQSVFPKHLGELDVYTHIWSSVSASIDKQCPRAMRLGDQRRCNTVTRTKFEEYSADHFTVDFGAPSVRLKYVQRILCGIHVTVTK